MGFEIENKYRVTDHETIRGRLIALGAESSGEIEQADHYLAHPARDFARTDEALRIRRLGDDNRITYKGPKHGGTVKTREEVEFACDSGLEGFGKLSRLFEALGFREVAVVRKSRQLYRLKRHGLDLEIALDHALGIGRFVEIETFAANEDAFPIARQAVADLADEFGLRELEPRSYLRMTLESSSGEGSLVGIRPGST